MRLSDILTDSRADGDLEKLWSETQAASEHVVIPVGDYQCHVLTGELETSRTNATPGYKLTFKIVEGNYAGRLLWLDCWLTAAAMPQTKHDLMKLGMSSLQDCEKPLPRFMRCKVNVVVRKDDDGTERNRVKSFDVIGFDPEERDPFAPEPNIEESRAMQPTIASTETIKEGEKNVQF